MNAAFNESHATPGGEFLSSVDLVDAEVAASRSHFSAEWGDMAVAAQAQGDLKPAWAAFLKRKFFVPILRSPDDNPKHYLLHFDRTVNDGKPTLVISETRERLDLNQGDGIVALSGIDLLLRLDGQGAIDVVMRDGVFHISRKRADWMRDGIEETKARLTIRKLLQAAAPGGPFPVLRIPPAVAVPVRAAPMASLTARVAGAAAYVRDARYFIPVTLSVAAIGMLFVLGEAGRDDALPEQPTAIAAEATPSTQAAPVAMQQSPQPFAPTNVPQVFSPWDNSFSVRLPGLPEEVELSPDEVTRMDGLPANFYRLQHDGVTYEMTVIQYADGMPPDLNAEMNFRQKLIVGEGTVAAARPLPMGTLAREIQIRVGAGAVRTARLVIHGARLCIVSVTMRPGAAGAASASTALASFQLQ